MGVLTQSGPLAVLLRVIMAPAFWLEQARGRRRLGLLLLYLMLALVAGFFFWWATSLNGLPDVGEPTGAQTLPSGKIPDDQNAFVLYRQAQKLLKPRTVDVDPQKLWLVVRKGWASADPPYHAWVAKNREALAVWRQGTERPLAVPPPPERVNEADLSTFANMALLEGSRFEAEGDMSQAWAWYRAVSRSSRHASMRTGLYGRDAGVAIHSLACDRITQWAAEPTVDAALLRQALEEVQAIDAMTPRNSEVLGVEYRDILHRLDPPERVLAHSMDRDVMWFDHVHLFVMREPERTRRILRLIFANWQAQVDKPRRSRPPSMPLVPGPSSAQFTMFASDPSAPPAARALEPAAMGRWFTSWTLAWRSVVPIDLLWSQIDQERVSQGVLVVSLADQLYLREHGKTAPSPEALVGPYLKKLPDGYEEPGKAEPDPTASPVP
ncbi:MAG TPA: hypothetical protein VGZ22_13525 [Isosphaeraceae bacterium]|nr:hypothetical protein [Isosphaeraceae bacterium]